MWSVYDDIRLHVARSYTSSADNPFSLISSFILSNHLLFVVLSFPPPSFLRSHHVPTPLQPPFLDFLCDVGPDTSSSSCCIFKLNLSLFQLCFHICSALLLILALIKSMFSCNPAMYVWLVLVILCLSFAFNYVQKLDST